MPPRFVTGGELEGSGGERTLPSNKTSVRARAPFVVPSSEMLVVPPRAELRHRPLESQRVVLAPVEPADASDLWNAVDTSRAHLEKWLPWVPFNTDLDA